MIEASDPKEVAYRDSYKAINEVLKIRGILVNTILW